jgi:6-phosphogluconolactonase
MRRIALVALSLLVGFHGFFARTSAILAAGTRVTVYASVGAELVQYEADVPTATLIKRGSVTLPGYVQEAWRHPSKPVLYVGWSNGGPLYANPSGAQAHAATRSGITAFAIDPTTGALRPHGEPASLRSRPIYITCDIPCTHLLAAYNEPSAISVHEIQSDGTIGSEVAQSNRLDVGTYAHQVRVSPSNTSVILVTRGNEPAAEKPEDPGALKVFRYKDGVLTNLASIAPAGGFGFRSRHLDFHPTRPWVFLTLEAQNKLEVYRRLDDDGLAMLPLFIEDTLAEPARTGSSQAAASVHVHPNGEFVYVTNRAARTVEVGGRAVFAGGENSIAVFAINKETGEPRPIQSIDTRGIQPRTFAIDPSGQMLVVGNQTSLLVQEGAAVKRLPANLAVFRIGSDGRLAFVRTYDVEAGDTPLLWVGIVPLGTY